MQVRNLTTATSPKSIVSKKAPENANIKTFSGTVTLVRDGDTIEVNGIAIRLAALNCPETGTKKGNYATILAKKFAGAEAMCELTGAKTYDRLVGYCRINGTDFGQYMMKTHPEKFERSLMYGIDIERSPNAM